MRPIKLLLKVRAAHWGGQPKVKAIASYMRRNKDEQWPSSHEANCEQNDWQTPVKTLPSLEVGNNVYAWNLVVLANISVKYFF